MKTYKIKSLMYLAAFILSAILYHTLDLSRESSNANSRQVVVEANNTHPVSKAL